MNTLSKERRFIFGAILALTLFGVLMVYEASSIYALKTTSDPGYFLKKQIISLAAGLFLFFLVLLADLKFLRKYSKEFLVSLIGFLIIVVILGRKAGGATRWIYLFGFNFQPSEMLKIFFLIYAADYVRRKGSTIKSFREGLAPLGVVLVTICVLLLLQPDLGTALFWVAWTFLFLFLHRARRKHLFLVVAAGVIAAFFLIKFNPYRFRRITAYINPFADPRGAGFQLVQSQIAYGEGGVLGVGFGEGRQKLFFLPAAHTDFVFSIIAEEFGMIGAVGILFVFFVIFHKMFNITKDTRDDFKKSVLWGITLIFFLEVVINIGVSCGLFPTKGLPLPFVSYGGSNLVTHYVLLGLFLNASRKEEQPVEIGVSEEI